MEFLNVGQHTANLAEILQRKANEDNTEVIGKGAKTAVKLALSGIFTGGYGFVVSMVGKTVIDSRVAQTKHNSDRKVMEEASKAMQAKVALELGQTENRKGLEKGTAKLSSGTKLEVENMVETMKKIRKHAHGSQRLVAATVGKLPGATKVANFFGAETAGFNSTSHYMRPLEVILLDEARKSAGDDPSKMTSFADFSK